MSTGPVVVALSARLGAVLPPAIVPLVAAGARLVADPDLPAELRKPLGLEPGTDAVEGVLITADPHGAVPSRWLAAGAELVTTPEPDGAALLDTVAVMDRLRSPGGCPWDAEQTHESLMPYLVEETYELYQALEDGDRDAVREELGDVLLQVLFHARVAAERDFDIDAVASDLVGKLVTRHPHVFAGEVVDSTDHQQVRWEELKRSEKQRNSCLDGVALAQPAVALAAKLVSRALKAGLPVDLLPADDQLFAVAARAKVDGRDPEAELRTAARAFDDTVRATEAAARAAGLDPLRLTPEQWRAHWRR